MTPGPWSGVELARRNEELGRIHDISLVVVVRDVSRLLEQAFPILGDVPLLHQFNLEEGKLLAVLFRVWINMKKTKATPELL